MTAEVEQLWSGTPTGSAPAPGWRVYLSAESSVLLLEPAATTATEVDASGLTVFDASEDPSGQSLLATDQGLYSVVEQGDAVDVRGSNLEGSYSGTPNRLALWEDTLWIGTDEGAFLWRGGETMEALLDGAPASGPFAPGGRIDAAEVVWVSGTGGMAALDANSWNNVVWVEGVVPAAMGVDNTGELWAVYEGDLVHVDGGGTVRRQNTPEPLLELAANPAAAGVWLRSEGALYHLSEGELRTVEGVADVSILSGMHVDTIGRLIISAADGVYRVGTGPSVVVLGLDEGEQIEGQVEVQLVPTGPDEVVAVSADIEGVALVVEGDATLGWTTTLSASDWADGASHRVTVNVEYEDGGSATGMSGTFSSLDFGLVTWVAHVEPLFEERCELCHAGDTETLLDTPEAWQTGIDAIIANISSGAMPLGSDPLSELQVSLVVAWRDGGFALE